MNLIDLFNECNKQEGYVTVKVEKEKFKKYEVDYKFIENKNTLYIFFEPSDGRTDWIVNFSYWRKPYRDMKIGYRVHGGFLESWSLVKDAVRARVGEKNADGRYRWEKIVIVGYSHGGALAVLCHECVWFEREDLRAGENLIGISFDGPRVYAGLWIKKELKERWRNFYLIRNQDDLITHLPPVVFFFRHVGEKVKVGAKPRSKVEIFKEWIAGKCKDSMLLQELVGIKPHYPEEVKKGIRGLENGRIPGLDTHVDKN